MSRNHKKPTTLSALQLAEDAFALLRTSLLEFGFFYALGSLPFLLLLIYAIEDASVGVVDPVRISIHTIVLTALYLWMRAMHCFACEAARRQLEATEGPLWTGRQFIRVFMQQARLAGASLWFTALSANIALSAGLAYGYSHSLVACGYRADTPRDCRKSAWQTTLSLSGVLHRFLALYSLLWFVLWVNIATLFYFLPNMLRSFLGIENIMAMSGWNFFGITFLLISGCITSFLANPLAKAFHTLLVFRHQSLTTGQDILSKLSQIRAPKSGMFIALAFVAFALPIAAHSAPSADPEYTVELKSDAQEIDRHAEQQLAKSEFAWRIRGDLDEIADGAEEVASNDSILHRIVESIRGVFKAIGRFWDWLWGPDEPDARIPPDSSASQSNSADTALRLLSIVAIIALFLLLLFAIAQFIGKQKVTEREPAPTPPSEPDLESETVMASQLPADRWLALAHEKAAAGEFRLATRAIFLGALAHLAARHYIALASSKANFEYERELRNRGFVEAGQTAFQFCRLSFDLVWYGGREATASVFEQTLAHYQKMKEQVT